MRFGVVTPTLNAEAYLGPTLDSIWGQRGVGVEIDHVIVDGGSTDGTEAIAQRYPSTFVKAEDDRGMYDAINRGMGLVRADVVSYINGDDLIAERALARVARLLESKPHVSWVVGALEYIDEQGATISSLHPVRSSIRSFAGLGWCSFPQQSMWVRRDLFDQVGPFDSDFRNVGDYEWIARALSVTPPHLDRAVLGKFRMHDRMLSGDLEKMHAESAIVQERYGGRSVMGRIGGRWLSLRLNFGNPSWFLAKKTGRLTFGA